jgi:hypothetical protein
MMHLHYSPFVGPPLQQTGRGQENAKSRQLLG